ncbi:MAG: hypothetical protein IJ870_02715 [Alphaproteobacteria bacterium]|nr:hypothetical protein [Alphaproteobacteria bacterium]
MKYVLLLCTFLYAGFANAQNYPLYEMDAVYLATLKAVLDYKMNDEENLEKLQKLREDKKFNQHLQKMLDKLNNNRSKVGLNKRVYDMLKKDGQKIYQELN